MATLHLELDIDSDVHPELYVRLVSIERNSARQEKLRQLAATGLIWEIARLHGPAFGELEMVTLAPAEPPPAVDAGAVADHAPVVPQDVPLLVDVVDEAEIGGGFAHAAPSPSGSFPVVVDGGLAEPTVHEVPAGVAPAIEAPSGRARSARIRRMKESGLFQNG